jgi:hypothetical protein
MKRTEVKVHEGTTGIHIEYDLIKHEVININNEYKSKIFKKYPVKNIIYDEHVIACFYRPEEHRMRHMLSENFIQFTKMFASYGMSVILDSVDNHKIHVLVFPNEKVKLFKT